MRHSPFACHRAVQSLPSPPSSHPWISDELLSTAIDHFFRPSCPYQRRCGSHVPGPLEARRRATKRRMTISTAFLPQEDPWPFFRFRSLFALPKYPLPEWRYEPPTLSPWTATSNLLPNFCAPLSSPHAAPVPEWIPLSDASPQEALCATTENNVSSVDWDIDRAQSRDKPPRLTVKPEDAVHNVTVCEACFKDFESQVAHVTGLTLVRQRRVIERAFRSCSPTASSSSSSSWRYNVMVMKHLTEWKCDPTFVFGEIANFEIPPFHTAETRSLLECLQKLQWQFPCSRPCYHQLYVKLASSASRAEASVDSLQDANILHLTRGLWRSARTQGAKAESSTLPMLRDIANKISDHKKSRSLQAVLTDVDKADDSIIRLIVCAAAMENWLPTTQEVLSCLPRERLVIYARSITSQLLRAVQTRSRLSKVTYKTRLSTWLELLRRLDIALAHDPPGTELLDLALAQVSQRVFAFSTHTRIGSDSLLNALLTRLSQRHVYQSAELERLFKLIDSTPHLGQDDNSSDKIVDLLATLFLRMKQESLPYQDLLESFIVLTGRHAGLHVVLQLLTALDNQNLTLRDFSIMDKLVADKISSIQQPTYRPSEAQRQRDAFALLTCRKIFETLSKVCSSSIAGSPMVTKEVLTTIRARRQLQHILHRAEAAHILPLKFRSLTVNMSGQERVDLIHQLAHCCSLNTTRTYLENWRTIYYLYRHLREHSLPIDASFTKSVVRVCIIRPLVECRFVSARRLLWVCKLVTQVEGEQVARGIEHDFWLWRGDLFVYAKGVYVRAGGDVRAKAHLGTMKKLKLI